MNKNNRPISLKDWEPEEDRLTRIIDAGELFLSIATGHNDYNRKKILYYGIATYFVDKFEFFPVLVIYGPPSTGKTATLTILRGLCWHSVSISAEAITEAALKAAMAESNRGTLIIEEGEKISTKESEGLLIARCYRSSAVMRKMVPDGRAWESAEYATFGATIIHRRNLFRDPALLRRAILVRTKRYEKNYIQVHHGHEKALDKLKTKLRKLPALPVVENIWEVEPGIFDCYRPILAVAYYVEDYEFVLQLIEEMKSASGRLKEEETFLEAPSLLKVILMLTYEKVGTQFTFDRINLQVQGIRQKLSEEFNSTCPASQLSANQRNRIIREDLGFEIRSSHGKNRIYLTILQLIKVCDEFEIKDDLIEEWRKQIKG